MLFGAVLRPDGFNATLESLDTSAAEKLTGVKVVRDGDFIGVVAPDDYTARHALPAIKAKWNVPAQPSNQGLFEYLKNNPENGREEGPERVSGSVAQAMSSAQVKLEEQYTVQYIAHAPLEPRAAVAEWERRQAHRLDRNAAPLRRPRRAHGSVPSLAHPGPRHPARHGQRLRRQTHRRGSH